MSNQSSYFSLSGFSGIFIGILGLIAIFLLRKMTNGYGQSFDGISQLPILFVEIGITLITALITILSLFVLWFRGKKKAKKRNQKLWSSFSKKQRSNVLISVLVFLVILIVTATKGYYSLITPVLLFLYGLILLNLGRLEGSRSLLPLGFIEIILAILAYYIHDNEILFLVIGIGILPIIYGIFTYNKR